jgi:HAD superfamily hydrolase (TIGR01549 family)
LKISYILFDAANTLIYKPDLFRKYQQALELNGYTVNIDDLRRNHKILSEATAFPDRTSEDFYSSFNTEVLLSLGILPNPRLLKAVFDACTYLEWDKYPDTAFLGELDLPIGILSNFNKTLADKITGLFGNVFSDIIISENLGIAKPATGFYKKAIDMIGRPPEEILYIGDSLKLDVIPALSCGMRAWLIDRDGWHRSFNNRLEALSDLQMIYNKAS